MRIRQKSFLCLAVIGMIVLPSCKKDEPQAPIDVDVVAGTDDAAYLLTNLVFTDDQDNITGYMTGYAFNEADPGEVSIPCETFEQAQELFLSWLPEGDEAYVSGDSIVWDLTDAKGSSQGKAMLVPGGENGAVAHLELPKSFPSVTSVQFLPKALLPENAERDLFEGLEEFYFLNIVAFGGSFKNFHGSGEFVVVREYDEDSNTAGIILFCHEYERNIWWDPLSVTESNNLEKEARKLDEMRVVHNAYMPYYSRIDAKLRSLQLGDDANDNYACYKRGDSQLYRYNFRNWEPEKVNAFQPTYQKAYIYFFSVEKKQNGEGYEMVFK